MKRAGILPGFAGLVLGALSGFACSKIGTPIPWMLGPMLALAVLRMAGANVAAIPGSRQAGQWIIGTALGLYFTPYVIHEVAGWWALLVAGALFAIALGYGGGLMLAWMANIDRTTGIFASVPGGAAEMATLGERFGARVDQVVAAHSIRVLIVTLVVPAAFAVVGIHGAEHFVPGATSFSPGGFALLMAGTVAGGAAAMVLRLPNPFILGALAVAIPLTAAEINLSAMPRLVSNAGQCLLGGALGARFAPDFLHGAPRFVSAVVTGVVGAIVVSAAFGWGLAWLFGLSPGTLILGNAPGGFAEMCVTANVLQLGVPLVTAFHLTRLVVLLCCTAPLFGRVRRWRERKKGHSR
jgi:uncharacterized protein